MTQFVDMAAEGPWPLKPGPNFIGDLHQVWDSANHANPKPIVVRKYKHGFKPDEPFKGSKLIADAILWPFSAIHEGAAVPYVAGGSTLVVAPMIAPTQGIGAIVLTAYVVGGFVYFATQYGRYPIVQPKKQLLLNTETNNMHFHSNAEKLAISNRQTIDSRAGSKFSGLHQLEPPRAFAPVVDTKQIAAQLEIPETVPVPSSGLGAYVPY